MIVLLEVLASLIAGVAAMCAVAGVTDVGPDRLRRLRREALPRIRAVRAQIVVLLVVLAMSALFRSSLQTVSELYGLYLTGFIFDIEGEFVAWVQGFQRPPLTAYFSWIYVYGYVFLLVFPFLAYGALEETATLKRLLTAYALNYALGLVVYTVVLAHGPRNVMPDLVTSLLYTYNPDLQALTSQVNENTNVFPSLHTSLSVTVATFALLTRRTYPLWAALAGWLAVSVMVATMYLGIHWAIDVLGGILLGVLCVHLSYRYVEPARRDEPQGAAPAVDD